MIYNDDLAGQRVLVTGASSGLGAECALAFSKHGAIVVLMARRKKNLTTIYKTIRRLGGNAIVAKADVTSEKDIAYAKKLIESELGGLDVIINNAGIYRESESLINMDSRDWDAVLDTNLRGPFLVARAFVPGMQDRGYGRVVNIISATRHLIGIGAFRISKVSLEILTKTLATEFRGTGVTATAFNPNWMKTESCSDGRSPKGAARAIVDLVQRSPEYLNGSVVDLRWLGRTFQLRRRLNKRGQFGP